MAMSTRLAVAARDNSRMTSDSPKAHMGGKDREHGSSFDDRGPRGLDRLRDGFGDLGQSVADDNAESFERTGLMFARMRESLGLPTQFDPPSRSSTDDVKLSYWIDDEPVPPSDPGPSIPPVEQVSSVPADDPPQLPDPSVEPVALQSPVPADDQPQLPDPPFEPVRSVPPVALQPPVPADDPPQLPDPPAAPVTAPRSVPRPLRRSARADVLRDPRTPRLGRSPLVERALSQAPETALRAPLPAPEPERPDVSGEPVAEEAVAPPAPKFVVGETVADSGTNLGRDPGRGSGSHASIDGRWITEAPQAGRTSPYSDAPMVDPPLGLPQQAVEPSRNASRLTFASGFLLGAVLIGAYFIITGDEPARQPQAEQGQASSQGGLEPEGSSAVMPDHSWLAEAAASATDPSPTFAALEPAAPAPEGVQQLSPDSPLGPILIARTTTRARFHPERTLGGLTFGRTTVQSMRFQRLARLDWSLVTGRRQTTTLPAYLENDAERVEAIRPSFRYTVYFRR